MFICLSLLLRLYAHHFPSPYPPVLPSDQTSLVSSFPGEDHLVVTPTLDHNGLVLAKPMTGAEQRHILSSASSLLPAPCAVKTSHPASQPHNTLECNHTSHFTPTCFPPTPLHPITISILAINCLSGTCQRASSLQPLRTELTSPQTPIPHTPWPSIQKILVCNPLLPSPKSVRLWGVDRHRTGWRLVGVPFKSPLQTVWVVLFRYMFDMILVTHKTMMTTSGTHIQGLHSTQVRHHTQIDLLTCRVCFVKHMMITTQVRHHTHSDLSTCRVCSSPDSGMIRTHCMRVV